MDQKIKEIKIVDVHRLSAGLMIYFSDGTSALFHAKFLHEMQNQDHNLPITKEGGERL